ncbi:MAG: O-acetyl-ADP-ribose deacetylase [Planctomycetota bacterium]|jgi:O-acetyl-ADP-ribose deacetylase (regulator of RNase III)
MNTTFGGTKVEITKGDITAQEVDAIVNAANSSLLGGGGVDGAIHRTGGPEILEACKAVRADHGTCPPGEAVQTVGGKLHARIVVHTVGPVWSGGGQGEAEILASAYRRSLEVASEAGSRSVAFPAIGTGAYGYPIEEAARIAIETVRENLEGKGIEEVRFVLFSDRDLSVYERVMGELD